MKQKYSLANPELYKQFHGLTNNPFFLKGDEINLFIPAYLRMSIQKTKKIEMHKLTATLNAYVDITLNLRELPGEISAFVQENVELEFANGDSILLSSNPQCLITTHGSFVTYLYGDEIPLIMNNRNSFMVPFDVCTMTTTMVITSKIMELRGNKIRIRFNFMDTHYLRDKFKLQQVEDPGEFRIMGNYLKVKFDSSEFGESLLLENNPTIKEELDRCRSYHYALYTVSQYRFPGIDVVSLFVPLWVFALANLTIFFQGPSLSDRISSIATLMVAYMAFIPFIRERIPLTSRLTFLDINVLLLVSTCLVCLWESVKISRPHNVKLFHFNYRDNVPFLVCMSILIMSVVYVLSMFLLHKTIWEPSYNQKKEEVSENKMSMDEWALDVQKWGNMYCDNYFSRYREHIRAVRELRL